MNIVTYSMDAHEFQALLNNVKDDVIERVNKDYGTSIDPGCYMFVLQSHGCLGRVWDKILGARKEDETRRVLVRVVKPNPTDHQAPASGALVHPVVGQTESQETKP